MIEEANTNPGPSPFEQLQDVVRRQGQAITGMAQLLMEVNGRLSEVEQVLTIILNPEEEGEGSPTEGE